MMEQQTKNDTATVEAVKETIRENCAESFGFIRDSVETLLSGNGKFLRPRFLMLAARFGDYDHEKYLHIGAAIEMLHMATLVHDDIIDGSSTRRGRPTLAATAGSRKAVLVGDYLFSQCFKILAERVDREEGSAVAGAALRICEGEIRQNLEAFQLETSRRVYLRRILGKTAALFILAFSLGARESGCSEYLQERFRRMGYCIGMSFQITDDILDYAGSAQKMGKPAGSDISAGVYTYPLIAALKGGDPVLKKLLRKPPFRPRQTSRIIQRVEELGGLDLARRQAGLYTERALREIDRLPHSAAKQELRGLTENLLVRYN